jgi:hypothetical protein
VRRKRGKKEEVDKKKVVKKRVVTKKKEFVNEKQPVIKKEIEDIEKPKINFNLVTGIMIFVLLIGASFSMSVVFGIAFLLSFIISFYNKTLQKKPFLPMILFFSALLVRTSIIWFLPLLFESKIYLDLIISLIVLIIIFLISFKIRK